MPPMFGLLRGRASAPPSASPTAGDTAALHDALDTLASVLRSFGRSVPGDAGPLGSRTRTLCEGWARHALTGSPPPTAEPADRTVHVPVPVQERAFATIRVMFAELRASEAAQLHSVGDALRGTLLDVLAAVQRSSDGGAGLDEELDHELERLRAALRSDDPAVLRTRAQELSAALETNLHRRRSLHADVVRGLSRRLRDVRAELREATRAAEIDALTGLANRAALDRRMDGTATMHRFTGQPECLVLLDIDHFKRVNDTWGHRAGDAVLKALGETLARAVVRRSDFVARYGGEEFAILLSDTDLDSGRRVVERLLTEVRGLRVPWDGKVLNVTISAGIAALEGEATVESWLDAADAALYRAKGAGRDRLALAPASRTPGAAPPDRPGRSAHAP